jgi:hypothetical protein
MKNRFIFDTDKPGINPGKFFSCLFILLLISGVIAKWFFGLVNVESADLGILVGPTISLILSVGWISKTKLQNGHKS